MTGKTTKSLNLSSDTEVPAEGTEVPAEDANKAEAGDSAPSTAPTRDDVIRESYRVATNRLREAHPDEFNKFRAEEAKARGEEWAPKPTAEQKAEAEVKALLDQYPHLRDRLA